MLRDRQRPVEARRLRVLVTGAGGFLGRHVVTALQRAGHLVRAVVRPGADVTSLQQSDAIEWFRADLRTHPELQTAFREVDALVHLAAAMSGGPEERFRNTAEATERLLEAMRGTATQRLVLCSSFSVYDWLRAGRNVDETLPVGAAMEPAGGYASAKRYQEALAARLSRENGWGLSILRPGFIWGPGNECPAGSIGFEVGPFQIVVAGRRRPPFTHVVNCAELLRIMVEDDRARGRVFNLVDGYRVTAWDFAGEALRRTGRGSLRIPLPYAVARGIVVLASALTRIAPAIGSRLPSLFDPAEFAERCVPRSYCTARLKEILSWSPPLDFAQCLERTYPSGPGSTPDGAGHAGVQPSP
jgi:nucleoside-diphosphate-sugar epimerase